MNDGGEIELTEKNWNRVIAAANKVSDFTSVTAIRNSVYQAGYREGVEEGKQSVFQQGFDTGYAEAFGTAFTLGKYKGLATALAEHAPPPVSDILDKTRRGACCVCAKGPGGEESLQAVQNEQRKHSAEVIETLRDHFDELLKGRGLSLGDFKL